MRIKIHILFIILLFASCGQTAKQLPDGVALSADSVRYAQGFTVEYFDNYTVAEIKDPWDSTRLLQRYILVDRNTSIPADLPKGTVIKVPLRNVVVYTSVHAAIIAQLGEADKITGVCEPRYMDTPVIKEGIKQGRIIDLGEATSPNVEKIIDIGAEVIIASPFQNTNYGQAEKIGIPIIEGADYMESLPLGRAEWGRFYGLLFGKSLEADSIFRQTEESYLALKELAATASGKPTVFSEKRYGSFWYVPCGDSYTAHFFKDAGARYIFSYLPGSGSNPMDFETVFDKAIHADMWLMKYNLAQEMTYSQLKADYDPYSNFDAFKNRQIFTCNTGVVPYYEEFPIHPDYLLKDLIKIFHPELLPDYTLKYYQTMQE